MSDLDDEAPEPTCGGCYCCSGTGYFSGDELRAQAADRERQLAEARAQQDRLQVVRDDCVQNESRLLAKITELERQLAEARHDLDVGKETIVAIAESHHYASEKLEAAEAKLRAVAALRDELLNQRDDTSHYTIEHRTAFEWMRVRLDAILGGDK